MAAGKEGLVGAWAIRTHLWRFFVSPACRRGCGCWFLRRFYKDELSQMREVSELFANLAILGIKIKDPSLTRAYFEKLVKYFSLQNIDTQKVIEALEEHKMEIWQ